MNHEVMPAPIDVDVRRRAIALTAASSVAMSSCVRTPATVAAALRVDLGDDVVGAVARR